MNNQKLIFVVDDDPFINMLVSKRLASDGYTLEAFECGEDCLEAMDRNPDLIILDYFFVNKNRQVMNVLCSKSLLIQFHILFTYSYKCCFIGNGFFISL